MRERTATGRHPSAHRATARLEPGDEVGPYRLEERLGHGSMGEVWRAEGPGGPCALKFPKRPSFLRHLRREGLYLAEVDHPNVARFIGADLDGPLPYVAMELVGGEPLRALCTGDCRPDRATLLCDQILKGLGAIHEAGILHLDLKPENVLVEPSGRVKIVDLGLGRATTRVMGEAYLSVSLASREVPIAGTLAYMAPEQRKGLRVDRRADLFAFGIMLHELLAGRPPDPATRLTKLRSDLSPRWDNVIMRLTHPDSRRRASCVAEARRLIGFTLAEKRIAPVRAARTRPVRRGTSYDEDLLERASEYASGMVVGGYELEEALGRGGFGEVWRARRGEEHVALKIALAETARRPLAREAELMGRVDAAAVLDDRSDADPPHLVLRLVEGRSLRLLLNEADTGGLPVPGLLDTFERMTAIVEACHRAGVLHGDLKPEHFLVHPRGELTLIDFGLARLVEPAPTALAHSLHGTRAHAGGTFDYMAPEQKSGRGERAADVYALGVIFFELLTGMLPRGPQRVRMLRRDVPELLDRLVTAMVAPEASARPTLTAVARELRACREGGGYGVSRRFRRLEELLATGRRSGRRAALWAGAAAAGLLVFRDVISEVFHHKVGFWSALESDLAALVFAGAAIWVAVRLVKSRSGID